MSINNIDINDLFLELEKSSDLRHESKDIKDVKFNNTILNSEKVESNKQITTKDLILQNPTTLELNNEDDPIHEVRREFPQHYFERSFRNNRRYKDAHTSVNDYYCIFPTGRSDEDQEISNPDYHKYIKGLKDFHSQSTQTDFNFLSKIYDVNKKKNNYDKTF